MTARRKKTAKKVEAPASADGSTYSVVEEAVQGAPVVVPSAGTKSGDSYVVAEGKTLCCARGVLPAGSPVQLRDLCYDRSRANETAARLVDKGILTKG